MKNSAASGIQTQQSLEKEKVISLKFKQYDDTFHNYEQVKWCGSRRKAGGGSLSKILHGPSMFAVKAKIYGVLYN